LTRRDQANSGTTCGNRFKDSHSADGRLNSTAPGRGLAVHGAVLGSIQKV